jgi:polysaccharide deacetylase family protein (PEP-CTERM system associated)
VPPKPEVIVAVNDAVRILYECRGSTQGEVVLHALTIDVEDYFQTEAMTGAAPCADWGAMSPRVEWNTWRLLDLLDRHRVRATLFFLGWVAERFPQLVVAAAARGHEVACHSYWHRPVYRLTHDEFREDTRRAKDVIESCSGQCVTGYRAPSFSILSGMDWAREILAEEGFLYSSSSHPIKHDLYSDPDASRLPNRSRSGLWELPITTWRFLGRNLPVGGGAYLRILPLPYVLGGLQRVAASGETMMIYLHPWEIDPGQPRMRVGLKSRLRQYVGLEGMEGRLETLVERFPFGTVSKAYGTHLGASQASAGYTQVPAGICV